MSEKNNIDLIINQPVSILNKSININYRDLFAGLGKMTVSGVTGNMSGMLEDGFDLLKDAGLQDQPGQIAWLLISQALTAALSDLVEDYKDLFQQEVTEKKLEELAERVEGTLLSIDVSIDASFFDQPQNLTFLEDFKSSLIYWLNELGWDSAQAESFHLRLKSHFVFSLNEIWANKPEDYKILEQRLKTPFTEATLEQRNWEKYNASLRELANERVFNEAFVLKQVYVRLNAYYITAKDGAEENIAVNLHEYINDWILNFDKDDALRVISGGPGCGKSSFSKMLVAEIAEEKKIPVLFIPLQHFDPSKDLIEAVEEFVSYNDFLTGSPLDTKTGYTRVLIVFDGLDELSMQGQAASETAHAFVDEIITALDRFNSSGNLKRQVIITGRDLSVQASKQRFRKSQQILHILPYFLDKAGQSNYQDKDNLLASDLRSVWWKKFGAANGKKYQGLPGILKAKNLIPVTREPLLNYLIALSYERKEIDFDEKTTLNSIYEDLLKAVYERQWDKGGHHKGVKNLSEEEFFRILEEIALAVWHGNGRTATESEIYRRCEDSNLTQYLEKFSEGAKKGVVRLLTAFYFREFGKQASGDRVFEFTHKSFGEYLTSKRIVRSIENIQDEIQRHKKNPDKGYNIRQALEIWASLCGPTQMDEYLFDFIKVEISIYSLKIVKKWQKTFAAMLSSTVRFNMPMEKMGLSDFSHMLEQSRNAEEAVLLIHYACALITKKTLKSDWGDQAAFGNWLKRINGQTANWRQNISVDCLGFLDMSKIALQTTDLYRSNLQNAILSSTNFAMSDIRFSNLQNVTANDTNFYSCGLRESNLTNANLEKSGFESANMSNVILVNANLKNALMPKANLRNSNLSGANLSGAVLVGAKLEYADLEGANLEKANLRGYRWGYDEDLDIIVEEHMNHPVEFNDDHEIDISDLHGANLKGANLKGANLEGANLEGANLEGTNLEGANL